MKRGLLIIFGLVAGTLLFAQEPEKKDKYDDPRLNTPIPFTLGDRDRLRDLGNELTHLQKTIDLRFEAMEKRLDGMDKRLDGMDKRLDGMDKRFDFLQNLLWTMVSILVALAAGIYFQFQRINGLLAKHDALLTERQRHDANPSLREEFERFWKEKEAAQRGAVGPSPRA